MNRTARGPALLFTVAGVLLFALVGCRGDDETGLPRVTNDAITSSSPPPPTDVADPTAPTSAPTSRVPPTGADLDRAQRSAYDMAVADQQAATAVVDALNARPEPNQTTADKIKAVSFNPFSQAAFVEIQRLSKAGVHVEGTLKVEWRRPVEVDLDGDPRPSVVWEICTTAGSRRVLKGDREIPQNREPALGRITQYAGADGRWMIAEVEGVGPCDS